MSRSVTMMLTAIVVALSLSACAQKTTRVEPEERAVVEPESARQASVETAQEEPWYANKSTRELNMEAQRRGFYPDIYFETDQAELTPEARERLEANALFLRQNPTLDLILAGHCDERGTDEYNLALGERRAVTAEDYLASLQIDQSRQRAITYGEDRPVCTESTETCWARNRRVHFVLQVAG